MENILDITPEPYTGIDADLDRLGFKYDNRYSYSTSSEDPSVLTSHYTDVWKIDYCNDIDIKARVFDGEEIVITSQIGKRTFSKTLSPEELHEIDEIVIHEDN